MIVYVVAFTVHFDELHNSASPQLLSVKTLLNNNGLVTTNAQYLFSQT